MLSSVENIHSPLHVYLMILVGLCSTGVAVSVKRSETTIQCIATMAV